jgi:hypothetical protein
MNLIDGLAGYEILKTGLGLVIIICFLLSAIYFAISSYSKNYQSINGTITSNTIQKTQTLTYTVNNKLYTQNIPFTIKTENNQQILTPTYSDGNCTVYYAGSNPDDYSVNMNPLYFSGIGSSVLCIIALLSSIWLYFLYTHKEVAGVIGGIDAASSVTNMMFRK